MEFRKQQAIYLQIADHVCEQILLEKWKPKDKIPSVREMAVSIEVNPNTVIRTYAFLEEKGIIYMQRGIGYFIAENARENTLKLKKEAFFAQELPLFFKTIDLLNLDIADIELFYDRYKGLLPRVNKLPYDDFCEEI